MVRPESVRPILLTIPSASDNTTPIVLILVELIRPLSGPTPRGRRRQCDISLARCTPEIRPLSVPEAEADEAIIRRELDKIAVPPWPVREG